jgi:hypothetical protein
MSNRLEQFVRDHREEFDGEEPDDKIWAGIQKDLNLADPGKKKQAPVVRLYGTRWSVAAAVILLIAGMTWYLNARRSDPGRPDTNPSVAVNTPAQQAQLPARKNPATETPAQNQTLAPIDSVHTNNNKKQDQGSDLDASVNEEMYHYAKLVEIKHKELKTIEKDEPLLYKQFSMDVNKLDSAYHSLQNQLPKNPNQEQILEAMLQNLQLQMGLLNHQLDIIKQINHSKKTAYEKAYKTT